MPKVWSCFFLSKLPPYVFSRRVLISLFLLIYVSSSVQTAACSAGEKLAFSGFMFSLWFVLPVCVKPFWYRYFIDRGLQCLSLNILPSISCLDFKEGCWYLWGQTEGWERKGPQQVRSDRRRLVSRALWFITACCEAAWQWKWLCAVLSPYRLWGGHERGVQSHRWVLFLYQISFVYTISCVFIRGKVGRSVHCVNV